MVIKSYLISQICALFLSKFHNVQVPHNDCVICHVGSIYYENKKYIYFMHETNARDKQSSDQTHL